MIQVDPVELARLGARLAALGDQLNRSATHDFTDAAGDPHVGSALLDVQRDWSRKRAEITGYLTDVGRAASAAADAYARAESTISAAATVPGRSR